MKLQSIRIKGLKCYKDSGIIPFYNLSVFIGENDAGKSTVLDALGFLLNNKNPRYSENETDNDFRTDSDSIELIATFFLENLNSEIEKFTINNEVKIRKTFLKDNPFKIEVYVQVFENEDLDNYESMSANDLKILLKKLEIEDKSNQDERKDAVKNYIKENLELPKYVKWKEIKISEISNFLPIFQRYSSSDYKNPEILIKKTLDNVYRSWFYEEDENGKEMPKGNFKKLQLDIKADIDKKVENELLVHIKRYKPEIINLGADCIIDFANGLSFSGLNIKDVSGRSKSLNQIGEGSKKKIFLSIVEWDSEINLDSESGRNIIRGYDEPDANLHYDAQRKMFYVINDLVKNEESNIQAIICTHSLTMIDRAPARCINHIIGNESTEESIVEYLKSDDDNNISEFINQISEISGIKNSSIFYEKCFLIVEGKSEQNALPIMYKKYTERSLSEDGVILINLETNGQWNNALKFLHANKKNCTVLLLDTDTQFETSINQVTKQKLEEIGFNDNFLDSKCFFIGNKEFEDVISDEQYVTVCNSNFPKDSKDLWSTSNFLEKRQDDKFSESLKILLSRECKKSIGKPEIASAVAETLNKTEIGEIEVIKKLFDEIQKIIQ
ncbi:MAG: AAA family ATPase [Spirochaetes bacterium]|nr:AAA family ATPase [Spirochaetota bacterium]